MLAFVNDGREMLRMRIIQADAPCGQGEEGAPLGVDGWIGEAGHAVRTHAAGEGEHSPHQKRHLGRGKLVVSANREQMLAGSLGSIELGAADPELLRARELGIGGASLGVREVGHAV